MNGADIYVISMATATSRRIEFATQAARAMSAWNFVDALTVAPPGVPYRQDQAITVVGRPLEAGEIGCFASHWSVWNQIINSDSTAAIVLEDDTIVDWNALDAIAGIDFSALGLDLVRLYSTHPFKYRVAIKRFMGAHSHLVRVFGMFFGTQGYIVTPHAARRLVMMATSIAMPVDWYMSRYWQFGFGNYCLFPFPIVERFSTSQIGAREGGYSLSQSEWLRRQASRVVDRATRFVADHIWTKGERFHQSDDSGPSYLERVRQSDGYPVRGSSRTQERTSMGTNGDGDGDRPGRSFTL